MRVLRHYGICLQALMFSGSVSCLSGVPRQAHSQSSSETHEFSNQASCPSPTTGRFSDHDEQPSTYEDSPMPLILLSCANREYVGRWVDYCRSEETHSLTCYGGGPPPRRSEVRSFLVWPSSTPVQVRLRPEADQPVSLTIYRWDPDDSDSMFPLEKVLSIFLTSENSFSWLPTVPSGEYLFWVHSSGWQRGQIQERIEYVFPVAVSGE